MYNVLPDGLREVVYSRGGGGGEVLQVLREVGVEEGELGARGSYTKVDYA